MNGKRAFFKIVLQCDCVTLRTKRKEESIPRNAGCMLCIPLDGVYMVLPIADACNIAVPRVKTCLSSYRHYRTCSSNVQSVSSRVATCKGASVHTPFFSFFRRLHFLSVEKTNLTSLRRHKSNPDFTWVNILKLPIDDWVGAFDKCTGHIL